MLLSKTLNSFSLLLYSVLFFHFFFSTHATVAASCCGGQAALPDLITGVERLRFSVSAQGAQVLGDAPARGLPVIRRDQDQIRYSILTLSGGVAIHETWQVALRTQLWSFGQIGDSDLVNGITILERDSIANSSPHIIWLQSITLPTGNSIYQSQDSLRPPTGQGLYRVGTGIAAFSTVRRWDFSSMLRVSTGFVRTFRSEFGDTTIMPGSALDWQLGSGYAVTSRWRLGGMVQGFAEEPIRAARSEGTVTVPGRLVWPVTLQTSFFSDEHSTFTFSYVDEMLIGPVRSTYLTRSVVLNYSYRY